MEAGRRHVLVIDDDAGIREMLELALTEAGHRVSLSNGTTVTTPDDVDVVLLDVRLGNTDATEVVARTPGLASLPIVVVTAAVDPQRAAAGLPGVSAVIAKPFDLDEVEIAIRNAIDGRRRTARP